MYVQIWTARDIGDTSVSDADWNAFQQVIVSSVHSASGELEFTYRGDFRSRRWGEEERSEVIATFPNNQKARLRDLLRAFLHDPLGEQRSVGRGASVGEKEIAVKWIVRWDDKPMTAFAHEDLRGIRDHLDRCGVRYDPELSDEALAKAARLLGGPPHAPFHALGQGHDHSIQGAQLL